MCMAPCKSSTEVCGLKLRNFLATECSKEEFRVSAQVLSCVYVSMYFNS